MTFSVELVGDTQLHARFQHIPEAAHERLVRKVTELSLRLQRYIQMNKLAGQVLKKKTGNLQSGVFAIPTQVNGHSVTGGARVGADIPYARIHEYGGTINHPGGTPYFVDKTGAVRFVSKKSALADRLPLTKAHLIQMPERSYMRSGLADMKEEIAEGMKEAVLQGVKEA